MPSDRRESLHLILGFCKDHGLLETYSSLCWEAGLDAAQEELAPHVSLLRVLLDWKRAFEARFHGTPRIIQAVAPKKLGPGVATLSLPADDSVLDRQDHGQFTSTSQAPIRTCSVQPTELQQGSVQTVATYMPHGGTAWHAPHALRQAAVQIMGQGSTPQLILAPPQQQQFGVADDGQQHSGLHAPQHSLGLHSQLSMQKHLQEGASGHVAMMPPGLPPRPPGAMPSHSSSLYSPPNLPTANNTTMQHTCYQDAVPEDWQGNDSDETGGNSLGHLQQQQQQQPVQRHALPATGSSGTLMASAGSGTGGLASALPVATSRRTSSAGSAPPVTRVKKGNEFTTQSMFLAVISQAGKGAVAAQLFDFRRPQRSSSSTARRSALLQLTDAQHDAMYALAGCEDVNFLISNVQSEVRTAMHKVFDIDKESFTVWFKNRGRNPSKTQHPPPPHSAAIQQHMAVAAAIAGCGEAVVSSGGVKRPRVSEAGTGSVSAQD